MNLINADALIVTLQNYADQEWKYGMVSWDDVYWTLVNIIENEPIIDPGLTKWIPCSQRLPKMYDVPLRNLGVKAISNECIVTLQALDGQKAVMSRTKLIDGSWHNDIIKHLVKEYGAVVTAWMPLPEPYEMKGGREDDER